MKTINIKGIIKQIDEYKKFADDSREERPNNIIHNARCSGEIAAYNAVLNIIKDNIKENKGITGYYFREINAVPSEDGRYDLPIGFKFIYQDKKYMIEQSNECINCGFNENCTGQNALLKCGFKRKDRKTVIFKEIK